MHVTHLSLADFRSYRRAEIELGPGVTVFVGPNGQGKTNLVEAVGYLATLGSHRVASDGPLVRSGAERAVVRAAVVEGERQQLVELELNPGRANRARINRSTQVRPRDALGIVRTVLFAPEDLSLVKGDPGERRRFLDELLTALAPRLAGVRADYDRVLKQRNTLLKSAAMARRHGSRSGGGRGVDLSTLDVWDQHLARTGAELLARRLELVAALQPLADEAYEQLAPGGGPVGLEYRSTADAAEPAEGDAPEAGAVDSVPGGGAEVPSAQVLLDRLTAALGAARPREVERGVTLVGPHRDELLLRLGALPAKGYASHGESWSLALALRLASYALLRQDGPEPVLVLDDVFAELDARRRERLAGLVAPGEQVLVTAAVAEDVPAVLAGRRFEVADGRVAAAGDDRGGGGRAAAESASGRADAGGAAPHPASPQRKEPDEDPRTGDGPVHGG
ncbi:DNA replication/repair protein RecF [Streptomyces bohaiensis]|uniref:DNA replication and repair protein RecF n=1 Tax=Streptomyces bohaiensis TaxID=1431344 RepID=A0ABX1C9P2_9ACTN|nr:DNA replication/repair protein RecF [Streptomyces bohaiensis]NJQ14623.1 DNA replication/repair protein RecF [Streptomyces bohaiensis]